MEDFFNGAEEVPDDSESSAYNADQADSSPGGGMAARSKGVQRKYLSRRLSGVPIFPSETELRSWQQSLPAQQELLSIDNINASKLLEIISKFPDAPIGVPKHVLDRHNNNNNMQAHSGDKVNRQIIFPSNDGHSAAGSDSLNVHKISNQVWNFTKNLMSRKPNT